MGVFLSVLYYIFIVLFMFAYIACFIINLIRAIRVNKGMKESYRYLLSKSRRCKTCHLLSYLFRRSKN